ncbi:hypothetical protein T484DRAFT_1792891 [Baffinella frigidus]|nr:hypothetical protein T484DRAFT_1792891 [Cryptophyta sp. CCMP2293]
MARSEIPEVLEAEHTARLATLFEGAFLCNDAGLAKETKVDNKQHERVEWVPAGYPTEVSLLTLAIKMGVSDLKGFKDSHKRVATIPFSSEYKFMATVHATGAFGDAAGVCSEGEEVPPGMRRACALREARAQKEKRCSRSTS